MKPEAEFFVVSKPPEFSHWKCHLFGGGEDGISWTPLKGKEPNFFWRFMQYLFFGNKWVKSPQKLQQDKK